MKITIPDPQNEGQTIEVEIGNDVLANAGLITPEQFTQRFAAELNRRTGAEVNTKLAEHTATLLADEAFRAQAMEAWGVKPDDPAASQAAADAKYKEQLEAARQDWEQKELSPLKSKLDKAGERVAGVMKKLLHGEIMQAATSAGIKRELLKPGPGGSVPPLLAMLEPLFGYDEAHDGFFARDGENYRFSAKPQDGAPYMGVTELLTGWATEKDNAWAVDTQRQQGPEAGDPRQHQQHGGVIRLTEAQASDHTQYLAAEKKAAETGARIEVEGMPMIGGTPAAGQ